MKFHRLILVSFFLITHFMADAQPDYGKIRSPKTNCKRNKKRCLSCDERKDVCNICNSNNELEIRLDFYDSIGVRNIYLLTYDSTKQWLAKIILDTVDYVFNKSSGGYTPEFRIVMKSPSKLYSLEPDISYDSIFTLLKINKLFMLQNFSVTWIPETFGHQILFKAGKKQCSYFFPTPSKWVIADPENKEAVYYLNIVNIFKRHFKIGNEIM